MNLQQIHLRITDAATGQPTPVRLRITDAAGTYYAPFGRLTDFATGVNQDVGGNVMIGAKKWCYIDGTCEILLPPGQLHIEITKGPEYKPIDEEITLLAGKMSLRFTIERWCDMRKEGWHSGDTRVHFLSPDAALLEGQGEDLAVVNLLACETEIIEQVGQWRRKAIPNIVAFSGQSFARQATGCGVAVNTHNNHPKLGSLGLLHCHRAVYPLTADGGDWTLEDWCGQCHRKKGLVVWTHPLDCRVGDFVYGAPLASLLTGNIDALEFTWFDDSDFAALVDYYRLLDAGLVLPLVGASGKEENIGALGSMRTYAFIGKDESLGYSNWIEAIRLGRTFVSNGPLLQFTLEEAENRAPTVHAMARSLEPFLALELVGNGEVLASIGANSESSATLDFALPTGFEGWLALRCRGEAALPNRPQIFAHTSPVHVGRHGTPNPRCGTAITSLLKELEAIDSWAKGKSYVRLAHVLASARTVLAQKLS